MTYELAKKLKDAGFPFNWNTNGCAYHSTTGTSVDVAICLCSFPTLSELIEACGDIYFLLKCYIGEWTAQYGDEEVDNDDGVGFYLTYSGKGKTPEEAIAELWLDLQK